MSGEDTYICSLSEELQEKAKTELNETHETRTAALKRLRQMVNDYPGLKSPTDDAFLLRFLRARKFDLDRSLQLIVNYFRVRKQHPNVYDNYVPSSVAQIIKQGLTSILPERDKHGSKILLDRQGRWNPDETELMDVFRYEMLILEKLIEDEETQICGVIGIIDLQGFGMRQAVHFTPSFARTVYGIVQDAFPIRIRGFHYIHEPSVIGYIYPIIRPFLKEKLRNRVHFHGHSLEDLHQWFSPDILPTAYGGNLDTFKYEEYGESLLWYENQFKDMLQYGLTEDTPGIKGNDVEEDALQGMSGTFRKLNVN